MRINIAICDDDIYSLSQIKKHIERYTIATDEIFTVREYTEPIAFLNDYRENPDIDILFLDVEMPGMDGLSLAKEIRKHNKNHTEIIFVSSYPKYMQASFGVHPYNYITKPISEEEFDTLLKVLISELNNYQLSKLPISTPDREIIVDIHDIIYISVVKGKKNILEYAIRDKKLIGKGNLQELSVQLSEYHFCTVYRGILANTSHIQYFSKDKIIFSNGDSVPISRLYEKDIKKIFADNIVSFKR